MKHLVLALLLTSTAALADFDLKTLTANDFVILATVTRDSHSEHMVWNQGYFPSKELCEEVASGDNNSPFRPALRAALRYAVTVHADNLEVNCVTGPEAEAAMHPKGSET